MSDCNSALSVYTGHSSYRDYEEEARELVLRVLEKSLHTYKQELARNAIEWPTGDTFNEEVAKEAIEALVKTWHVGESWKFCIDYLHQEDNLHCFGVKYSEPTRRKPVPKATASVYFYLLVHSQEAPVLVMYVLEGQRLVHRPTDRVFHEVWLRNVIQNKVAITESLNLMAV